MNTPEPIENKDESNENFPVEKLIRKEFQGDVMAFYHFARAADDIGDDPLMETPEKIAKLDAMGAALTNKAETDNPICAALHESLKKRGVSAQHALDLLTAFKRDCTKLRYANWEELLDYCRYSAAPVGRFLLDLHHVPKESWPANDALCAALQIVNHLQDCADDYGKLNRVYIPEDMLAANGANAADLSHETSSPGLRATQIAMLDKLRPMIALAYTLPPQIADFHLRMDTSIICVLADKMEKKLRALDPLAERTKLSKFEKLGAFVRGVFRAVLKL